MPLLKDKSHEFEIESMGYVEQKQFNTLVRLIIELQQDSDSELKNVLNLDDGVLQSVMIEYARVSLMVVTDHPVNAFFTTPTTNKVGFKEDFLEFTEALKIRENSIAFGELVKAVEDFDSKVRFNAPTPPTDPN